VGSGLSVMRRNVPSIVNAASTCAFDLLKSGFLSKALDRRGRAIIPEKYTLRVHIAHTRWYTYLLISARINPPRIVLSAQSPFQCYPIPEDAPSCVIRHTFSPDKIVEQQ
jgi:hypothetical protein